MADSDSILQLGIEAARAGDKAEARELFRLVTREDPGNVQGWLWLAGVAEDRDEKRAALEHVLELDPANDLARKGLAALASKRAGASAADTGAAAATAAVQSSEAPAAAETLDTAAAPPPSRIGARTYETPAATPAGETVPEDTWTAPAFDADEYDLQDYQQPVVADMDERGTTVVVEDEEPRRRGTMAWLPVLLGLGAVVLAGLFLFNQCSQQPVVDGPGVAGTVVPGATGATVAETTGATGPITATDVIVGGGTEVATGTAPGPAETAITEPVPGTSTEVAAETTPPPPAEQTAAPPTGETIVVVPPEATVVPPAEQPPAAETTPAPEPPAAATPAPPPPATPVDVAAANPAIVAPLEVVQAGQWAYTFTGQDNIATGAYGGAPPTRGQYQIVLLQIANNSAEPQTIPDGFFVIKDAQGRIYDFNRAASVDYLIRFGGPGVAADIGADTALPPNSVLTSVPLLFDVPADASNLVLFSRENLNQGFLIR
jgi:outer membrane biosynthesis protein TonB